jgi:hypothetical protein
LHSPQLYYTSCQTRWTCDKKRAYFGGRHRSTRRCNVTLTICIHPQSHFDTQSCSSSISLVRKSISITITGRKVVEKESESNSCSIKDIIAQAEPVPFCTPVLLLALPNLRPALYESSILPPTLSFSDSTLSNSSFKSARSICTFMS